MFMRNHMIVSKVIRTIHRTGMVPADRISQLNQITMIQQDVKNSLIQGCGLVATYKQAMTVAKMYGPVEYFD